MMHFVCVWSFVMSVSEMELFDTLCKFLEMI